MFSTTKRVSKSSEYVTQDEEKKTWQDGILVERNQYDSNFVLKFSMYMGTCCQTFQIAIYHAPSSFEKFRIEKMAYVIIFLGC